MTNLYKTCCSLPMRYVVSDFNCLLIVAVNDRGDLCYIKVILALCWTVFGCVYTEYVFVWMAYNYKALQLICMCICLYIVCI